ncbi:hypothetical protein ABTL37_20010, partial [Acinetobacter baumannii]
NNGRFLYRAATALAGGTLRLDADATLQKQLPASPVILQAQSLVTPVDANYNPADARIDEHRYHAALRFRRDTAIGVWDSTAS